MTDRGRILRRARAGFSTTELVVASMLMALLGLLLGTVWAGLCRPVRDASARCRLALEANLAAAAIAQDVRGNPPADGLRVDPRPTADEAGLRLCLYANPTAAWTDPPDEVTTYARQGRLLTRTDASSTVILANELSDPARSGVEGFVVTSWSDSAGNTGVEITMTFVSAEAGDTYDNRGVRRPLTLVYKLRVARPS